MKYQVKSGRNITYPDGSYRGGRFYIVDGDREPQTITEQGDALERCRDRQAVVSPVDASKLIPPAPVVEEAKPKAAKKKTSKKKTSKK